MKKKLTAVAVAALVVYSLWFGFSCDGVFDSGSSNGPGAPDTRKEPDVLVRKDSGAVNGVNPDALAVASAPVDALDEKILGEMRAQFSRKINHPKGQIMLIETLVAFLRKRYPGENLDYLVQRYVEVAFPGAAADILLKYKKLAAYNEWLEKNRSVLWRAPGAERARMLVAGQDEFFGGDAAVIWKDKRAAGDVYAAMDSITHLRGEAVERQFDAFLSALPQSAMLPSHGASQDDKTKLEWVALFLNLDVVQDGLSAMNDDERRQALRKVREKMGFSGDQVLRLEQFDAERDERMRIGDAYMLERRNVMTASGGTASEQELDKMRNDYFGARAAIIKAEEEAGYFRFATKRRYGLD